jgi:hypothetical protein
VIVCVEMDALLDLLVDGEGCVEATPCWGLVFLRGYYEHMGHLEAMGGRKDVVLVHFWESAGERRGGADSAAVGRGGGGEESVEFN